MAAGFPLRNTRSLTTDHHERYLSLLQRPLPTDKQINILAP